jgi:thiol-disulfide isomerase/thioredoxin
MKVLIKNLAIFVSLSLVISILTACPNSSATQGTSDTTGQSTAKNKKDQTDSDKSKDDSPPAPKAIATAEIEMLDGETFKLEDNKGKVVLINLWAIWCGPCIKEMPHLNEMQEKYKDKDFIILGLNTGDDFGNKEAQPNIEKFVERQKLNYKIGWSHRELTSEFFSLGQMNGIPQSFLINREGKLKGIFQGGGPNVIISMKETVDKIVNE